jgi:3-hydroxyisobutyrate dehydrogenase-like beta-hydroxyacid dehydrogenase
MYKAFAGDLAGLKFALDNARKDLRYYTQLADALAVPSPVGDAVHQAFVTASALGLGERFVPSLIQAQEKLLGVKILPG